MNLDKIVEELKKESRKGFHDYGRFVVEFEQMVLSVKLGIFTIIKANDLKKVESLRILLHDQTAAPLISKLRALLVLHFKEIEPGFIKASDQLFINALAVTEKRNLLVHGSIFPDDLENLELYKDKIGKFGLTNSEEIFNQDKLILLTAKTIMMRKLFDSLALQISGHSLNHYSKIFNENNLKEIKI